MATRRLITSTGYYRNAIHLFYSRSLFYASWGYGALRGMNDACGTKRPPSNMPLPISLVPESPSRHMHEHTYQAQQTLSTREEVLLTQQEMAAKKKHKSKRHGPRIVEVLLRVARTPYRIAE